jgi:hypothetical protein
MGRIDTLKLMDPAPGGSATPPTFVVNTAVTEVIASFPAAPLTYWGIFGTANNQTEFEPNDNLTVLSMALVLPFCFGLGSEIPYWAMVWRDTGGGSYAVSDWGQNGYQQHYATNQEIGMNQYLPWNPLIVGTTNSQLAIGVARFSISMLGVPAALNGTTQDIQIILKVLHNLDIT